ncbi:hypothetical protein [Ostreibacterium oceani]|uniref:DUF3566 domain-containing protein n=1 Tax=Ostreibacterium oceani TaxID=2654998 RepID=A0A6N7F0E7_9GAMM|nr:hypothetical protein [Ostreibacterium oceani]MPV86258.1 hypothetical protein [Ostreibacterium oceani]
MEQIEVKKVSAGTVFKLFVIGLTVGFLPVFLLFGVLGMLGLGTLTWNDQPVTGIKAIFVAPFIAVLMSLIFTALLGSICALGLWVFSFFRPLKIEFVLNEKI